MSNDSKTIEDKFVSFESIMEKRYKSLISEDRSSNVDYNGNYIGDYEPEREYVSVIIAFLDEFNLELGVIDITNVRDEIFMREFRVFRNRVNYIKTRFILRDNISHSSFATRMIIEVDTKNNISDYIEKIRKIVNQSVHNPNKQSAIFNRLNDLQREVDKPYTTADALFIKFKEVRGELKELGEDLKPLAEIVSKVATALYGGTKRVELITTSDRPKLIEDNASKKPERLAKISEDCPFDDEIPF